MAAWTGVAAFVGQSESDWLKGGQKEQASIDFYGLRIEEKTEANLRIGASAGQFNLRLFDPQNLLAAEKYDGRFFSLYLRWPVKLNNYVKFHTLMNYQFNLGTQSIDTENREISWNEFTVNTGLSFQSGLLAVRPFISYRSLEGDVSTPLKTEIFNEDKYSGYGLIVDYFVEHSAFIRLMVTAGANQTMLLSFAREY